MRIQTFTKTPNSLSLLNKSLVPLGNITLIFIMAVVNALTVKEVSAGYWGSGTTKKGVFRFVSF